LEVSPLTGLDRCDEIARIIDEVLTDDPSSTVPDLPPSRYIRQDLSCTDEMEGS